MLTFLARFPAKPASATNILKCTLQTNNG